MDSPGKTWDIERTTGKRRKGVTRHGPIWQAFNNELLLVGEVVGAKVQAFEAEAQALRTCAPCLVSPVGEVHVFAVFATFSTSNDLRFEWQQSSLQNMCFGASSKREYIGTNPDPDRNGTPDGQETRH